VGGKGFAPKDPSRRARRNADPIALRVITAEPVAQPDLPTFEVEHDGELTEFVWPARTREWWQMWQDSPLSAEFTATDWSELLDAAVLHARFWRGDIKLAAELRLRVAKFGATPEDRARLRITFAQADEAEDKRTPAGGTARQRRGPLTG
jgi:hypothetical protein